MNRSKIAKALDYLDDDLIAEASEEKIDALPIENARKPLFTKKIWGRVGAVAAAAVLLITGGVWAANAIGQNQTFAVVAFDVNPSLEIRVNQEDEVIKVIPLNEDAKTVVEKMDFKGVGLDVTVNALIGSMLKHGYLSIEQNSILISVNTKNDGKAAALQRELSQSVSALLLGGNIEASVITQTFDYQSEQSGVSAAKAALIHKIVAAGLTRSDGSKYTYEQLSSLRVHELKLMLESKGFSVDGIEFSGKASEGKYIGEHQALEIVCQHAKVTIAAKDAEIELDFDDDSKTMVYEVEFTLGGFEYEYELNAVTGAIIDFEKEIDD